MKSSVEFISNEYNISTTRYVSLFLNFVAKYYVQRQLTPLEDLRSLLQYFFD